MPFATGQRFGPYKILAPLGAGREAKTISQLSHPHICTLHDIGHQDGTDDLVMEFLEGETLTDRLAKGPLPTDQVLRYGIEITDALDKAHRHGNRRLGGRTGYENTIDQ